MTPPGGRESLNIRVDLGGWGSTLRRSAAGGTAPTPAGLIGSSRRTARSTGSGDSPSRSPARKEGSPGTRAPSSFKDRAYIHQSGPCNPRRRTARVGCRAPLRAGYGSAPSACGSLWVGERKGRLPGPAYLRLGLPTRAIERNHFCIDAVQPPRPPTAARCRVQRDRRCRPMRTAMTLDTLTGKAWPRNPWVHPRVTASAPRRGSSSGDVSTGGASCFRNYWPMRRSRSRSSRCRLLGRKPWETAELALDAAGDANSGRRAYSSPERVDHRLATRKSPASTRADLLETHQNGSVRPVQIAFAGASNRWPPTRREVRPRRGGAASHSQRTRSRSEFANSCHVPVSVIDQVRPRPSGFTTPDRAGRRQS